MVGYPSGSTSEDVSGSQTKIQYANARVHINYTVKPSAGLLDTTSNTIQLGF